MMQGVKKITVFRDSNGVDHGTVEQAEHATALHDIQQVLNDCTVHGTCDLVEVLPIIKGSEDLKHKLYHLLGANSDD